MGLGSREGPAGEGLKCPGGRLRLTEAQQGRLPSREPQGHAVKAINLSCVRGAGMGVGTPAVTPRRTDPVEKMRASWTDAGLQMEVSQQGSRGRGCHPGSGSCREGAEVPPRPPPVAVGRAAGRVVIDALPDQKVPGMPTWPRRPWTRCLLTVLDSTLRDFCP